ncbi:MAG: hypothetical protein DDT21_02413 [Syntrophomonadaceae bacterium]|nr:hypothetical protein [Bacillota bacterium]
METQPQGWVWAVNRERLHRDLVAIGLVLVGLAPRQLVPVLRMMMPSAGPDPLPSMVSAIVANIVQLPEEDLLALCDLVHREALAIYDAPRSSSEPLPLTDRERRAVAALVDALHRPA